MAGTRGMVKIEFLPGTSIREAILEAIKLANTIHMDVAFDFNGANIHIIAGIKDSEETVKRIISEWESDLEMLEDLRKLREESEKRGIEEVKDQFGEIKTIRIGKGLLYGYWSNFPELSAIGKGHADVKEELNKIRDRWAEILYKSGMVEEELE